MSQRRDNRFSPVTGRRLARRGIPPFDEPPRPECRVPARTARLKRFRTPVDAVLPTGVDGHQPSFEVPEDQSRDSPDQRTQGPRREASAGVGQVALMHLPVDHIRPAGSEAAQRHRVFICGEAGGLRRRRAREIQASHATLSDASPPSQLAGKVLRNWLEHGRISTADPARRSPANSFGGINRLSEFAMPANACIFGRLFRKT
jgi:hypothetical protein